MNLKDNQGIISLDFLFSIILFIIITSLLFGFLYSSLSNVFTIKENVEERLIADNISVCINSVSSNEIGYSKIIHLKSDVVGYPYYIKVSRYNVNVYDKFNRGESAISPINIRTKSGGTPIYFLMNLGSSYKLTKIVDNKNITYVMFYRVS
ncbi:hypothetical protein BGI41_06390 [Methanobrevibacter sp. 87.7]|uniref:hypothetical protein n=1 Tax=Methanobrevibacter sp. 87.7 TaxID=387957 RepID=UPI000B4FF49E|nr:hypothetical protein [Methanobrevibacter sp. 87.7]OWT32685.1 hypothetical protein BGI41_06390 [Methanobrevibacter sp. 87.7]